MGETLFDISLTPLIGCSVMLKICNQEGLITDFEHNSVLRGQ